MYCNGIHSFIPDISIAPLLVHYYSGALLTTALMLPVRDTQREERPCRDLEQLLCSILLQSGPSRRVELRHSDGAWIKEEGDAKSLEYLLRLSTQQPSLGRLESAHSALYYGGGPWPSAWWSASNS